jgi:hypothetical protein
MKTSSYAFANLTYTLQANFARSSKEFIHNPNASNYNRMTDDALAYQQIIWLSKTPQLTPLRRNMTATRIVMELPAEQWSQAVIDCATELTA